MYKYHIQITLSVYHQWFNTDNVASARKHLISVISVETILETVKNCVKWKVLVKTVVCNDS